MANRKRNARPARPRCPRPTLHHYICVEAWGGLTENDELIPWAFADRRLVRHFFPSARRAVPVTIVCRHRRRD
jgi:hypothetical protein